MISIARELRAGGTRIGFVPTMGALHQGHLSIMTRAREMCDNLIISVFVNPTQFGPSEDFEKYPRDLARDAELAFGKGVDLIFAPSPDEIYPAGFSTFVNVDGLSNKLEGASRPGHFRGVTTIVSKLFNIVRPHFAFFGRKDAQQVVVLKKMVNDLAIDTEIVVCPTVREEDGLALSSRNAYLSDEERKAATVLKKALEKSRTMFNSGERNTSRMIQAMRATLAAEPLARVDYVAITDTTMLDPIEEITSGVTALVSMAVYIGTTRLIDNIVLNGEL